MITNNRNFLIQSREFSAVFNVSLRDFWSGNIHGFDRKAFTKWLNVPEGVCTLDYVEDLYSIRGRKVLEALIGDDVGPNVC